MRPDPSLKTLINLLRAVAQGSTLLRVMMIGLVWLGVADPPRILFGHCCAFATNAAVVVAI